jgi:uncharacterized membrane protein
MTYPLVRQAQYGLAAGLAALILIETQAFAKARDLTFEGNWLLALGALVFAVLALWLTCLGALRADRGGRFHANSGGDRSGPVYTDIDGQMQVH